MNHELPDTNCLTDTDQRRRALIRILLSVKDRNLEEPPIRLLEYIAAPDKNVQLVFDDV